MRTQQLYDQWAKFGMTPTALENMRRAIGGHFTALVNGEHMAIAKNIVTNEGLNSVLSVYLTSGTQITSWRLALVKTNTAAAATMTYATPVFTEVTGSDVSESSRAIWTPGSVSSQSVTNSASAGQYTAAAGFTAYGLALVGGGSAPSTLGDTAGGGTLYAYGLFSASRTLVTTDVLECTYTFGSADDGA